MEPAVKRWTAAADGGDRWALSGAVQVGSAHANVRYRECMESTQPNQGSPKRDLGWVVWILVVAAFLAFAVYSGLNIDPARY